MKITRPHPARTMPGRYPRERRTPESTLVSKRRSQSSSGISVNGLTSKMPTLFTRTSTSGSSASSRAAPRAVPRSAAMPRAPPPISRTAASTRSCARPFTITWAPSRESARAMANPMPAVEPVTSAFFPRSSSSIRQVLHCGGAPNALLPEPTMPIRPPGREAGGHVLSGPSARERRGDAAVDGQGGPGGGRLVGGEKHHRSPDVRAGDLGVQEISLPVELLQLFRREAPGTRALRADVPPQPRRRVPLAEHRVRVDHVHPDPEWSQLKGGDLPELVAGGLGRAVRAEVRPGREHVLGGVDDHVAARALRPQRSEEHTSELQSQSN